jgi:hypothetical protein
MLSSLTYDLRRFLLRRQHESPHHHRKSPNKSKQMQHSFQWPSSRDSQAAPESPDCSTAWEIHFRGKLFDPSKSLDNSKTSSCAYYLHSITFVRDWQRGSRLVFNQTGFGARSVTVCDLRRADARKDRVTVSQEISRPERIPRILRTSTRVFKGSLFFLTMVN